MKLHNRSKNMVIASQVIEARSFWLRAKGLLGRSSLNREIALWIDPGNSIHTWFMQFDIDAVFVDRHLVVKGIRRRIKPWRITQPVWSARSVFELSSGVVEQAGIEIGDQLYVGN